jgi:hypothetical protein
MSKINTFEIYKLNQLLFLEAGFVHLNTILSGAFAPLFGLTFIFVSIATYLVYCFMGAILNQYDNKFEDIFNVISSDSFPSAGKNFLVGFGLVISTIPIILFYNQEFIEYPYNSALCTIFSSLLGGLAYVLVNKNGKSIVAISFFTIISLPLVIVSLVIGGVFTLPVLFIFFYIRSQNAD